jgi:hypothetical protein
MSSGDQYRQKAAEMFALARGEVNGHMSDELKTLGASYLRLAEEADHNSQLDLSIEIVPPKTA